MRAIYIVQTWGLPGGGSGLAYRAAADGILVLWSTNGGWRHRRPAMGGREEMAATWLVFSFFLLWAWGGGGERLRSAEGAAALEKGGGE